MILRNSSLPSACRSQEAKQNPRSSHTSPTHPRNVSIHSCSKNRFLPEGNAVATQIWCAYKYQGRVQQQAALLVWKLKAKGVWPTVLQDLAPTWLMSHPSLPSLGILCGSSNTELTARDFPKNRPCRLFPSAFLDTVPSAWNILCSQGLLRTCFSLHPNSSVLGLSHPKESELGSGLPPKTELRSPEDLNMIKRGQLLQMGLEISSGSQSPRQGTRIISGVFPGVFRWYVNDSRSRILKLTVSEMLFLNFPWSFLATERRLNFCYS